MKTLVFATVTLTGLWLAGCQNETALTEMQLRDITQAVLETHTQMTAAAESRDADAMFSYISDRAEDVIIQDGILFPTWQEAKNSLVQSFTAFDSLQYRFDRRHIRIFSPEIAVMTSIGTTTVTASGQTFTVPFANTSVFALEDDGQWKLVHGHHSIPNPQ